MRASFVVWLAWLACCASAGIVTPTEIARLTFAANVGVLSLGQHTYAFADRELRITRDGTVVKVVGAPEPWTAAEVIEGPGGTPWIVAIAGGTLWRITSSGGLHAVGDGAGLAGARVLAVAGHDHTFAIGVADGVVVSANGRRIIKFPGGPARIVSAARERVAIARDRTVELLDLEANTRSSYPLAGAVRIGFLEPSTSRARLVVVTREHVFVQEGRGVRRLAVPAGFRDAVVAGRWIWMLGDTLTAFEGSASRMVKVKLSPQAGIHPAADGGVWLADIGTVHYALDPVDAGGWEREVAPIFSRTCARCHRPGGSANLNLSSADAWRAQKRALREVLRTRTMPPEGTVLPDAERQALLRWLE